MKKLFLLSLLFLVPVNNIFCKNKNQLIEKYLNKFKEKYSLTENTITALRYQLRDHLKYSQFKNDCSDVSKTLESFDMWSKHLQKEEDFKHTIIKHKSNLSEVDLKEKLAGCEGRTITSLFYVLLKTIVIKNNKKLIEDCLKKEMSNNKRIFQEFLNQQ